MKIKLSKKQWEEAGIKAGWIKTAQQNSPGANEKARQYAERIFKGENRESVLQGAPAVLVKNVDAELAKLVKLPQAQQQSAATPQQQSAATPQQQSAATPQQNIPQYSISKVNEWAMSTGDPVIMDYIGRTHRTIQTRGIEGWEERLNVIMRAMNGDRSAFQLLRHQGGGHGILKK